MYHFIRTGHRWVGIIAALFLATIAVTGFLLATKDTFGWVKPPTHDGQKIQGLADVVSVDKAASAAFALNIPELKTCDDIDRIDYRPNKNVFKIVSVRGYHEVQVDGKTGKVLNVAHRIDQLAEDIHDLSYFADWMHLYWLPVVAIGLITLSITGVAIFVTPIVRRWRYHRSKRE
ncbi:MAG: PepSY domain-containing protein [Fimbriimonadales bacterium]